VALATQTLHQTKVKDLPAVAVELVARVEMVCLLNTLVVAELEFHQVLLAQPLLEQVVAVAVVTAQQVSLVAVVLAVVEQVGRLLAALLALE
jgi:hypothetical protein